MTPKEKARQLYNKMEWFTNGYVGSSMLSNTEFDDAKIQRTKSAANIIIDEILSIVPLTEYETVAEPETVGLEFFEEYWREVKKELESF